MDVKKELERSRKREEKAKKRQASLQTREVRNRVREKQLKRAEAETRARERNSFSYRLKKWKWERRITAELWDCCSRDYMHMVRRADRKGLVETEDFKLAILFTPSAPDFFYGGDYFLNNSDDWRRAVREGIHKLCLTNETVAETVRTAIQKQHPIAKVSDMQWAVPDEFRDNQELFPYFILTIPGPHPVSKL